MPGKQRLSVNQAGLDLLRDACIDMANNMIADYHKCPLCCGDLKNAGTYNLEGKVNRECTKCGNVYALGSDMTPVFKAVMSSPNFVSFALALMTNISKKQVYNSLLAHHQGVAH